jgi:hypothetical protein
MSWPWARSVGGGGTDGGPDAGGGSAAAGCRESSGAFRSPLRSHRWRDSQATPEVVGGIVALTGGR